MRDCLADHSRAEILGLEVGQVNESEEVGGVPTSQLARNLHCTQNGRGMGFELLSRLLTSVDWNLSAVERSFDFAGANKGSGLCVLCLQV
jgi:hypothetical protein